MLLCKRLSAAGLCLLATTLSVPALAQQARGQPALTALTAKSGVARAPEQAVVVFEHADLRFRIDPAFPCESRSPPTGGNPSPSRSSPRGPGRTE